MNSLTHIDVKCHLDMFHLKTDDSLWNIGSDLFVQKGEWTLFRQIPFKN